MANMKCCCRIWAHEGDEDDSCSQSVIGNASHISSQSKCGSMNDRWTIDNRS